MGGCCSSSESGGIELLGYTSGVKSSLQEGSGPKRHVLRVKAHVMVLSFEGAELGEIGQWTPWLKDSVFVYLYCIKESEAFYLYQVVASGLDGREFSSFIEVPRVRLRKISANFVFWKDEQQEKVWGLNFSSERDTLKFLAGCTPLSVGIKANYGTISPSAVSSLPPAPPPPSDHASLQPEGVVPYRTQPVVADGIGSYQHNDHMSTTEYVYRTTPSNGTSTPVAFGTTPSNLTATPIMVGTTPSNMITMPIMVGTTPSNMITTPTMVGTTPLNEFTTPTNISPPTGGEDTPEIIDSLTAHSVHHGNQNTVNVNHVDDVMEGRSLSSMASSEEDNMITNIDDLSEGDGEEGTSTCQVEDIGEGDLQWTSPNKTSTSLLHNFTLHDIPEVEEEEDTEEDSTSPHVGSVSSSQPDRLSLSSPRSNSSLNPPNLPLSPAPGELLSPTSFDSDTSSPRFTALFDTFSGVESPTNQFDQILRELSKNITLDKMVSDSQPLRTTPSPVVSRGEGSFSDGDFASMMDELRGNSIPTHTFSKLTGNSTHTTNVSRTSSGTSGGSEAGHHRQRRSSTESFSSLKMSASLDYLSEVQEFMENFSREMDLTGSSGEGIPLDRGSGQRPSADLVVVKLPSEQVVVLHVDADMTVGDVLIEACEPNHYVPEEHFVVFIEEDESKRSRTLVPSEHEKVFHIDFTRIEIWEKEIVSVDLHQLALSNDNFGLKLEPVYGDDDCEVLLSALVRGVSLGSPAYQEGVTVEDEIVIINDIPLFEITWTNVQELLKSVNVSMTLRSRKAALKQLKSRRGSIYRHRRRSQDFMKDMNEDVVKAYLDPGDSAEEEVLPSGSFSPQKLKAIERIEKTINDLVMTERDTLKHLMSILEIYYQPLQRIRAPSDEVNAIFGSIFNIIEFEKQILQDFESVLGSVDGDVGVHHPLRRAEYLVQGIASVFDRHGDRFKTYSMFCTSHCRLQHLINSESSVVKYVLTSCVPHNQLNLRLETVFTKPIQRVLQYPLYLHVLEKQVAPDSPERRHLDDVIAKMDIIVNYINEMQRVSDNFTIVFDSMLKEVGQWKLSQSVSVQCLRFRGLFTWLNPVDELSKGWKKGQGPDIECFVFRALVLLFVVEKKRRKTSRTSLNSVVPSSSVPLDEVKFKTVLLCSTCVARALPDSDGVTNMWQLFSAHMGSIKACRFILRCRSKEQKLQVLQLFSVSQ